MKFKTLAFVGLAGVVAPLALLGTSRASDHADTPDIADNPGTDITDVHIFPSATNPNNVVLTMSLHPLIPTGQGLATTFDPNVLYQFKIDNTGDGVEDLVIQARFSGNTPGTQRVSINNAVIPSTKGSINNQEPMLPTTGAINTVFSPTAGTTVFAGAREDAFFFDLEQFFNIFPDRATPINKMPVSDPNTPRTTTFRAPGAAKDFLVGYNVLTIAVEVPRKLLLNRGGGTSVAKSSNIGVWCTTSVPTGNLWKQMDRLARPAINELFATVANDQHKKNDEISPIDDKFFLKPEINNFMVNVAGRSQAIADVVTAVTIPDVLKANLASTSPKAAYLGVETGGFTGSTFGGRALNDDVIDLSLGIVFGNTIPALGLAPDDGREIATLTTDNVGADAKHFLTTFPYLGDPR